MSNPNELNFPKTPQKLWQGPLFVLSLVRSGSSLLYALLNQHSKIALLYEGDLPTMELFLWGQFRNGKWRERWEFWNQGPSRHGIAIESMPAQVVDIWEATRIVYQSVARKNNATIWGEKTPHWYDSPLKRAEKFPDARFIFLWRNVHDVMRSLARGATSEIAFKKIFSKPEEILLGNERLRHACDALKAQGKAVHEVDYEDLTANPPACMQQICRFLEIPEESEMNSLQGADRSAICTGAGAGEVHELVRGDRIVSERKPSIGLPTELRAKVDRYICRWKSRYKNQWPKYPTSTPEGIQPPSFLEVRRDQLADRSRLAWHNAEVVALHQIRPLFYPKKYVRASKAASQKAV